MSLALYFDTETTGLPDFRAARTADHQPHIVQLAMLLIDRDGRERGGVSLIIKPDGWTVPEAAADVHGITTEIAASADVPILVALALFSHMARQATTIVAHNMKFDNEIICIEWGRAGRPLKDLSAVWPPETICTMEWASPIVNLPPTEKMIAAGFNKPKPPKLEEAYSFFLNREFRGAHDAMNDVRACRLVHEALIAHDRDAKATEAA